MRWSQRHGVQLIVVAIDNHQSVIRYAHAALRGVPSIVLLQAEGRQLPFREQTFDFVVCSTMLHHLERQDGITLLRAMAAVARYGVIVNDLVRSRLHYYGAHGVLAVLSRNRLTRHDGPLSVLRAYSISEVRAMADAAGLHNAQVHQALGYRWLLIYTPEA
jgi:ubiquinone/menaquinone biosynthesis C-methylase UbiE